MSAALSYAHAAAKKEPVGPAPETETATFAPAAAADAATAANGIEQARDAPETARSRSATGISTPAEISPDNNNISSSSSSPALKHDTTSSLSSTPTPTPIPAPAALAPAPLPSKNAWGKIESTVPTSIDLKSIIDHNNSSNSNNTPSFSSSTIANSNIKWVPFKGANIVISDSSSSSGTNHSSANGNSANKKKSKKSKKKSPPNTAANGNSASTASTTPSSSSSANGSSSSANNNLPNDRKHQTQNNVSKRSSRPSNTDSSLKNSSEKLANSDTVPADVNSNFETDDSPNLSTASDDRSQVKNTSAYNNKGVNGGRRYNNNGHGNTNKFNNNGSTNPRFNKNYYNNFYPQQNFQYYQDFSNGYAYNPAYQNMRYQQNYNYSRNNSGSNSNGNYHRNNYNNNTTNYSNYNHNRNFNYRTKYTTNSSNTPAMNWISPESRLTAVNSLAMQLDYYFDISNLLKDMYLRKHMNSQGWINLDFITGFYRVRALSCGDLSVIRDSLDHAGQFEWGVVERDQNATPESSKTKEAVSSEEDSKSELTETEAGSSEAAELANPIANIKIRALAEPLNWVLPESDRDGCGLDDAVPTTIHKREELQNPEVEAEAETEPQSAEPFEQQASSSIPESIEK